MFATIGFIQQDILTHLFISN